MPEIELPHNLGSPGISVKNAGPTAAIKGPQSQKIGKISPYGIKSADF
jgi:hypothetical protein